MIQEIHRPVVRVWDDFPRELVPEDAEAIRAKGRRTGHMCLAPLAHELRVCYGGLRGPIARIP